MLLQKSESRISFKQLQGFANTHSNWHLNEEMDVVNSDVEFINLKPFSVGNLPDEELTIHSNPIKLHRIHSILAFPHEVESILSKSMFGAFQIHFLSPKIAHANFDLVHEPRNQARLIQEIKFYKEGGNSSLGLKTEVPLPRM